MAELVSPYDDDATSNDRFCAAMPLMSLSPVFSCISTTEASALLEEVILAFNKEVCLRSSICNILSPSGDLLKSIVSASASMGFTGSTVPTKIQSKEADGLLRQALTVFNSIWLSEPYLGNIRLPAILESLTEDMIGH